MDHPGSKTRSVGQTMEKPFEHSRGPSFGPIFIKLCQDWIRIIPGQNVGQNIEKPCEHHRGHSFDPILIKLGQVQIWIFLGQKLGQ